MVLGVAGAAVAAFFVSERMTPIYEATAKVRVEGGQTPGVPSVGDLEASQELAQGYGDLIKTRPILEQVIEDLSLPYGPDTLSDKISVSSPRRLIQIKAEDPGAQTAAILANTTAQTFIDEIRDRQFTQISQFQSSLGQYGIPQDPSIIAAQAATLSIVEEAVPPGSPSSPRTILNISLAAILGLLVAIGVVFVLERLDASIKSPDQLKSITGLPFMGLVLRYGGRNGKRPITLSDEHNHSVLAESYKFLRTNLEFASLGTEGLKSLLITSSSPEEGKTTTAANLAISIASGGKSVILVDSDLRRPAMHRVFGLTNQKGLTNVLLGVADLEEASVQTLVGLRVIPSGPLPPDPTLILQSSTMKDLIKGLENLADIVILDSPPLLAVTDPMILASQVDGVLLVVDPHSSQDVVRRAAENLRQANPPVMVSMLNKVSTKGRRDYYYYHYYYYYYSSENGSALETATNGKPKLFSRIFKRQHDKQEQSVKS